MNIIVKFPTFAPGIPELSPQRYAHPPRPRPRPQHPRQTLPRRHPPRIRLHPRPRQPNPHNPPDQRPHPLRHPRHLPLPILRHTHCPTVLIENFFIYNKQDLAYLLSQEGRREIIETIIDGIERCVLTLVE